MVLTDELLKNGSIKMVSLCLQLEIEGYSVSIWLRLIGSISDGK